MLKHAMQRYTQERYEQVDLLLGVELRDIDLIEKFLKE
jgi:hypothetical protein